MRKFAKSALISTAENTAAQLIDDTTNEQYWFVQTSAGNEPVLGPIKYGTTVRYTAIDPQREVRNTVLIGGATVEVIAASTRYKVEIWNPEADYEGKAQGPQVYAYTSAAALTGNAFTDRLNVYSALVSKINAYAGNNCTAYGLVKATYTLGTSAGDAHTNFVVGEVVTQETSGLTAQVAACSISGGTFAADNAAGTIWLYNLSAGSGTWLETAKTLTAAGTHAATDTTPATTNCVVTVTNATTYFYQGIVVVDDAGYFTSNKSRGGINRVGLTSGFATATASVIIAGQYSIGIGTDMLAQRPVFDIGGQALIAGNIDYDFSGGVLPVAGQSYEKIIIDVVDGDEEALGADKVSSVKQYVLWFNNSSHADFTHDLLTAIGTVAAK
jgi:hypothetical protein